jgi:hypothetical protein
MANPGLSELVTTTLRNRSQQLADNVTNNNALFSRLNEKGNIQLIDGGRTIVEPMEYAENATFQYYNGYEVLDISPSDVITAAEFDWKQASVNVTWSGLEAEIQNSGREQQINLIESRIKVAEKTMSNNLSTGAYSDGTGSGGKQVGGLQLLVPDDPTTGTVGGIDRSTAAGAFYQSQLNNSTTVSSTNIQTEMNELWVQTVRQSDKPDLIVADNNFWNFYLSSLQANQRFTNDSMASAGFDNLKYMSADVIFDTGGGCPANHMYFLNTDYIRLKVHKGRNMVPMDEKISINQDASVVPLLWAGNMTLSNASLQGVLINA